ncbi:MAG: hypothetical protein DMG39_09050 [Acidobacteria bacterium]|nr:MAG: hypothetical protein DMG39_09050 [Acidobacteriota bacterium]
MNANPFPRVTARPSAIPLPRVSREFLPRAALAALFLMVTYQFDWEWLRFLTSESALRVSALLGRATARVSLDTINVQGQLFQIGIACTFVDVFLGSIPLLWDLKKTLRQNASWLLAVAMIFFVFNIFRLEIAQGLYFRGVPWIVADEVLGGFSYFAVWLFLWHQRTWKWA